MAFKGGVCRKGGVLSAEAAGAVPGKGSGMKRRQREQSGRSIWRIVRNKWTVGGEEIARKSKCLVMQSFGCEQRQHLCTIPVQKPALAPVTFTYGQSNEYAVSIHIKAESHRSLSRPLSLSMPG